MKTLINIFAFWAVITLGIVGVVFISICLYSFIVFDWGVFLDTLNYWNPFAKDSIGIRSFLLIISIGSILIGISESE